MVWYAQETSRRLSGREPVASHVAADASASAPDAQSEVVLRFVRNPQPISAFSVPAIDGGTIDTSSWRGKVTLLNFWATWCGPCRAEVPDLVALQKKYPGQLQIVGIADDMTPDVVRTFAQQFAINYPNAMINDSLRSTFRIRAIPTTYLVDRDGRVVQKHIGILNPVVTDHEVRALLGLATNVRIETFDDVGQVSLQNAAHATEIPGVDLTRLTPAQKTKALVRLNTEKCTCGCNLTLAECRINDPNCEVSPPIAATVVDRIRSNTDAQP